MRVMVDMGEKIEGEQTVERCFHPASRMLLVQLDCGQICLRVHLSHLMT